MSPGLVTLTLNRKTPKISFFRHLPYLQSVLSVDFAFLLTVASDSSFISNQNLILCFFEDFKFSNEDFSTEEKTVLTYHRVLEAIKFANAFRPYFSDPDYPKNKTQLEEVRIKTEKKLLHYCLIKFYI